MGGEYRFTPTNNISDININLYQQKLLELADKYHETELNLACKNELQKKKQPNWMSEKDYQKYFTPVPIEETWNSHLYQKLKNGEQLSPGDFESEFLKMTCSKGIFKLYLDPRKVDFRSHARGGDSTFNKRAFEKQQFLCRHFPDMFEICLPNGLIDDS